MRFQRDASATPPTSSSNAPPAALVIGSVNMPAASLTQPISKSLATNVAIKSKSVPLYPFLEAKMLSPQALRDLYGQRLTEAQHQHITDIISRFAETAYSKYCRGQAEHGGNLWRKRDKLPDYLMEEVVDLVVYTDTLLFGHQETDPVVAKAASGSHD